MSTFLKKKVHAICVAFTWNLYLDVLLIYWYGKAMRNYTVLNFRYVILSLENRRRVAFHLKTAFIALSTKQHLSDDREGWLQNFTVVHHSELWWRHVCICPQSVTVHSVWDNLLLEERGHGDKCDMHASEPIFERWDSLSVLTDHHFREIMIDFKEISASKIWQ